MSNDQAQTPMGGQTKMTKTRAKQKTKRSKLKTVTMIKDTTRTTTIMGGIQERLNRLTHQVGL